MREKDGTYGHICQYKTDKNKINCIISTKITLLTNRACMSLKILGIASHNEVVFAHLAYLEFGLRMRVFLAVSGVGLHVVLEIAPLRFALLLYFFNFNLWYRVIKNWIFVLSDILRQFDASGPSIMIKLTSDLVDCVDPCFRLLPRLRLLCVHNSIEEITEVPAEIINITQLMMSSYSCYSVVYSVVVEKLVKWALK